MAYTCGHSGLQDARIFLSGGCSDFQKSVSIIFVCPKDKKLGQSAPVEAPG
jgi:hypothetical protein